MNVARNEHRLLQEARLAGQGAVLLCAILWSTSGLFIKLLDWHPVVISGGRSILAAGVLFALRCISAGRKTGTENISKNNPGNNSEINSRACKNAFLKTLELAGFGCFYAATMILFVIANKLTASANAILLQYAAPMWTALLGWLVLKEKPRWEHWFALVLVGIGLFLVLSGGLSKGSIAGDIIALLSGVAFAGNSVVLRLKKDGNPADILLFSHIICALFSVPFFILYPPVMDTGSVFSIVFMGIFQIGAASALFAYGLKRVPAIQAMLTATIEPVLNPVWVLLVTGEKPALSVLTGGSLIIAAVVFSSVKRYIPRFRFFPQR